MQTVLSLIFQSSVGTDLQVYQPGSLLGCRPEVRCRPAWHPERCCPWCRWAAGQKRQVWPRVWGEQVGWWRGWLAWGEAGEGRRESSVAHGRSLHLRAPSGRTLWFLFPVRNTSEGKKCQTYGKNGRGGCEFKETTFKKWIQTNNTHNTISLILYSHQERFRLCIFI